MTGGKQVMYRESNKRVLRTFWKVLILQRAIQAAQKGRKLQQVFDYLRESSFKREDGMMVSFFLMLIICLHILQGTLRNIVPAFLKFTTLRTNRCYIPMKFMWHTMKLYSYKRRIEDKEIQIIKEFIGRHEKSNIWCFYVKTCWKGNSVSLSFKARNNSIKL